jgi:hypothetical protein
MRLQLCYVWLLVLTLASQLRAGPPGTPTEVLPQLIATRQAIFSIPFRVEHSSDPTWQPVEAQLYVSTDRGSHWRLYTSVPTAEKHFTFRAGGDGEFWFAICTADRSGQTRPKTVESPGLRVLVDTKPPVLKIMARPAGGGQVTVHWEIDELNLKPNSLTIVYRPSATEPWQAVAIDPRSQDTPEAMQRGDVSFQPKSGLTEIPIRVEVSDVAGNTAVANAQVRLDRRPDPPRPNKPTADVGPALMPQSNEAVTVAGNPAIGRKFQTPSGDCPNFRLSENGTVPFGRDSPWHKHRSRRFHGSSEIQRYSRHRSAEDGGRARAHSARRRQDRHQQPRPRCVLPQHAPAQFRRGRARAGRQANRA